MVESGGVLVGNVADKRCPSQSELSSVAVEYLSMKSNIVLQVMMRYDLTTTKETLAVSGEQNSST